MTLIEKLNNLTDLNGDQIPFKDTTDELIQMICMHGKFTGSYYFCGELETDIDVIMPRNAVSFNDVIQRHRGLYLHNVDPRLSYHTEEFESCYVKKGKYIYNLLIMYTPYIYDKWVYATNKMKIRMMQDLDFELDVVKDKEFRVSWFERYKHEFMTI